MHALRHHSTAGAQQVERVQGGAADLGPQCRASVCCRPWPEFCSDVKAWQQVKQDCVQPSKLVSVLFARCFNFETHAVE